MEDERETAYLRQQRRKKMSLSCCFHGHNLDTSAYDSTASFPSVGKLSPIMSPSSWFRSKGGDFPETKGKCRRSNIIHKIGGRHARRHHSADFSYDPLSYALNFDEGGRGGSEDGHIEEFSSRLPVSPPRRRLRDLGLPSPVIQSVEMSSPAAGRRIGGSSTATTGGKTAVERPRPVTREISVEQC
ncbi:hypothetical protein CEY00_Acc15460 [Actinidia chinensis var. chinensis]|uniref:Uncharacterized protein n=1 Tax=Actinidia chinensis var. chinensis TaxID=1590841 RepID=A0A2R6QMQ3_ACTCC|nr:hypothetical protein CEY00_Acc15460 [Actinidia chinensis var. chinensis]